MHEEAPPPVIPCDICKKLGLGDVFCIHAGNPDEPCYGKVVGEKHDGYLLHFCQGHIGLSYYSWRPNGR